MRKKRKTPIFRNKLKKIYKFIFGLLIVFAFIMSAAVVYIFFFFPGKLSEKIMKDIVQNYNPAFYDDSDKTLILKLENKPDPEIQNKLHIKMKKYFGLEVFFETIHDENGSGIIRIKFFRDKKVIDGITECYIYWIRNGINKTVPEKEIISSGTNSNKTIKPETKKNSEIKKELNTLKEEIGNNYEKIEEKRKNEKEEKIDEKHISKIQKIIIKEKTDVKNTVKIAIIIDDVGYSYNSTFDFLNLGIPLTFAVIPDMSESKRFYELIKKGGYEVILHIPMEPLKGKIFVEKNALFSDDNDDVLRQKMNRFLSEYPDAAGANNHMGSRIVTDSRIMNIVLEELARRNKFWLDSMTSSKTIAKEVASLYKMNYYERNVFLDNEKDYSSIKASFLKLLAEAKIKKFAIGIGHVQSKELVKVLKDFEMKTNELGFEFVTLK
jgi:uncharacterized protein